MYDGVAYNAKLAFIDCGVPGSGLYIPGAQVLYSAGHSAGARVHTNSWGTSHLSTVYYSSADTDQYLYDNTVTSIIPISVGDG